MGLTLKKSETAEILIFDWLTAKLLCQQSRIKGYCVITISKSQGLLVVYVLLSHIMHLSDI